MGKDRKGLSGNQGSPIEYNVHVLKDHNTSPNTASSLVASLDTPNPYMDLASLGLKQDAQDQEITNSLEKKMDDVSSRTQTNSVALFVTKDKSKNDDGMELAIQSQDTEASHISYVILGKGFESETETTTKDIFNAIQKIKGMRNFKHNPLKYLTYAVSRNGQGLTVIAQERKTKKKVVMTKKDALKWTRNNKRKKTKRK